MEKMFKKYFIIALPLLTVLLVSCTSLTGNVVAENTVKIPVDQVTNQMQKYVYESGGVDIVYFAVRDADGSIKTAFDACEVCGGAKGYSQEGAEVICNNCGLSFSIAELGVSNKGGGCWPVHLDYRIVDDNIVIKESDIAAGRAKFA